ncbi:uncharacterized protein [Phaseolus vulgaris]|uniref:uncharacterized protein n=1 Tax=Phaseolus vulgaris TaxID=3885 RepID=UPI0035CB1A99
MDVQHEDPTGDFQDAGPSAADGYQRERMSTMSSFERQMMDRLDSFAENQRSLHDLCVTNFQRIDTRFNNMDARFMTLDEQIEAVQNHIFDLQISEVQILKAQISEEGFQKVMKMRPARSRSEEMTMQQLAGMMQGLQEAMAASKAEQERMQADVAAAQARNDELHRANKELRRGWRDVDELETASPPREFTTPFSQAILETAIPNTFTGPKLFMSTLTGMAMDWFINLPEGHITSFAQLSQLFREQYLANRAPAPVSYDLFDVKQYQGETLKEYISRFGAQVVKVGTTDEPMIVYTFRKGVCPGSFSKSLNRSRPKTFAEVRRRAVEHIASEGEAYEKCTTAAPARPKAQIRTQPARVHEAATERRNLDMNRTYETRRTQPRGQAEGRREGNRPLRHNFVVELKDLIVVPNIADRLRPPVKFDKVLGPHKELWCEFHKAFGHHINNCLALGYQLDELVKNGFLKDYLTGSTTTTVPATPEEDQAHEVPVHGEVHTISGGFSGGGPTASQRQRYVRSASSVAEKFPDDPWESDLVFIRVDLRDVIPHDNDPVVISVVTAGRKITQ